MEVTTFRRYLFEVRAVHDQGPCLFPALFLPYFRLSVVSWPIVLKVAQPVLILILLKVLKVNDS